MEQRKKFILIVTMFILVLVSVITYIYMNKERDVTYQGTFVNCTYNKGMI